MPAWRRDQGSHVDAARRNFHAFLITHGEAMSIADYFTVRDGDQLLYRPTVHYAYHPCDAAVLSGARIRRTQLATARPQTHSDERDHAGGIDELGVLLAGHKKNAYWYGSQLSVDEARRLAPYNNATSLQVTVAVLSGMVWAIENPSLGLVEPDEMDFAVISRSACRTSGRWLASTPTGIRCTTGRDCSRKKSIRPTPGSSRTSASS